MPVLVGDANKGLGRQDSICFNWHLALEHHGVGRQHRDSCLSRWDSLKNNQPVSFEAVLELVSQMVPDIALLVCCVLVCVTACTLIQGQGTAQQGSSAARRCRSSQPNSVLRALMSWCVQGATALRGSAINAAPYTVLRRLGNGIEVRRYEKQARVHTAFGEVYNKDSYDYATNLLLSVSLRSPVASSASPSKHKA